MTSHQGITLAIFSFSYLGMAVGHVGRLGLDRTGIVLLGAIALLLTGSIGLNQAINSVNFPSLIILFSLMVVSSELQTAGFYQHIAHILSRVLDTPKRFLGLLMLVAGILSAFLNNDVVCFTFTPVVTAALLRKRMNPIPFLIPLALASNIGCALTLIGNAQNVVVGELAHLKFGDYMLFALPPVFVSLAGAYAVSLLLGRKKFQSAPPSRKLPPEPTVPYQQWESIKGLIVILGIIVLFFTPLPRYLVALAGGGILLCSRTLQSRQILQGVDWQLLILFTGLFVVVGAFEQSGLADTGVNYLIHRGWGFEKPYSLSIITGILSNLINNSAAVMLLVHIVDLKNPLTGYLLALSNTFAGNLLLIGSVANIIVALEAEKFGVKISFWDFAKYGLPVVVFSYAMLFLWIFLST